MLIDFHVQIFADVLRGDLFRSLARQWSSPFLRTAHSAHAALRLLPSPLHSPLDQLTALAPIPGLLIESTAADLKKAMRASDVDRVVAFGGSRAGFPVLSPLLSNDQILNLAEKNPSIVPGVTVEESTPHPVPTLRGLARRGAKVLGLRASFTSRILVQVATDLKMPIVFLGFEKAGNRNSIEDLLRTFPDANFVLNGMNRHQPNVAMDLAEKFPNLSLDTSWQPAEIIGEAVRRIGEERVLWASNWPWVGANFQVSLDRIQDCRDAGMLTANQADAIRGQNAARLLGMA